jgi:eukaryotic-like serine/threonine-protein kinase
MSLTLTTTNLSFTPIKNIGIHGKNSEVYTAHDTQLDREIVVKKISKAKLKDPSKFFEEGRKLSDSEHQHVVPIKFASEDAVNIYLGMPFYQRGSLRDLIDSRFLTVREIVRYSIQFLSGLNNIHIKKLIHFDIKPDNILLSDTDEALIADFGIAQNTDLFGLSEMDQAYFKHIPPEYFSISKHSMLFDIYSSGLTIYRLCNGNKNFYSQFAKYPDKNDLKVAIVNAQFPDRNDFKYHIPKKLRKIIKKALQIKPEDRYQTVLDFTNELASVDKLLDWVYTEGADMQEWVHDDEQRKISIILKKLVSSHYDLTTQKTIHSSGNTVRVASGCINNLDEKEVEKRIIDILEDNE